jgi:Ca-activated chloride channel family protein
MTDEALIVRRVIEANAQAEARLHVFGVGYDVNTHLLDGLAAENGGSVTYVQPGESLETTLTGFYQRIAHPVLTDVEVTFEGMETSSILPQRLPDLFQGSSLLLTGLYRATASTVTVRVRGHAGGEEREYGYEFPLDQGQTGSSHDFVPRLWATRRVGELLDQVRVEGERSALIDEIRELGLGYGLVTPYTTFAIQARTDGAASATNMALYANQAELGQAWGQVTVQARVQNQLYQQAAYADMAMGANVVNNGPYSLAQVADQIVDLALLRDHKDLDTPITLEWIDHSVGVDRTVIFGSEEYFALAGDPAARHFLQSGPNVVFVYHGQIVAVQDAPILAAEEPVVAYQTPASAINHSSGSWLRGVLDRLVQLFVEWLSFLT